MIDVGQDRWVDAILRTEGPMDNVTQVTGRTDRCMHELDLYVLMTTFY